MRVGVAGSRGDWLGWTGLVLVGGGGRARLGPVCLAGFRVLVGYFGGCELVEGYG